MLHNSLLTSLSLEETDFSWAQEHKSLTPALRRQKPKGCCRYMASLVHTQRQQKILSSKGHVLNLLSVAALNTMTNSNLERRVV